MVLPDRARVPAFFLLSFLIGIPRLFTLAVSDSLFLSHYSASEIPLAYLGRAVLIPVLGWLLFQAEKTVANRRVLLALLVVLTAVLAVFVVLFRATDWAWPYLALLVWVSAEWTLSGMVFWNTANRHFTLREAKRVFGLVSTGEVVAAVAGGFLVAPLLSVMEPVDLLYLSMGGHLLAFLLILGLGDRSEAPRERPPSRRPLRAADLFRSPYLVLLFGLAALDFLVHYFTDTAFFLEVQNRYSGAELTSFLGTFLGVLGIGTLMFKLFVTPALVQRAGIGAALALGPLVTAAFGAAVFAVWLLPGGGLVLPLLVAGKFVQMLLGEALFSPVYYVLFQPLPGAERTRIQNFAEAVPGRVIGGLGGAALLLVAAPAGPGLLSLAMAALAVGWWLLARRTAGRYRSTLRANTEERLLPGLARPENRRPAHVDHALASVQWWQRLASAWMTHPRRAEAPWMDVLIREERNAAAGDLLDALQAAYPAEPLRGIRASLTGDSPVLRAYALEILESSLDPALQSRVMPLFESDPPSGDDWARLIGGAPPEVRPLFRSLCLRWLGGRATPADEDLLFLKSVPLFGEVPYWELPRVLERTAAEAFEPGSSVIVEGEMGHSLHLVRRGQVRVHLGDRTLTTWGPGGLFGEYAVFDPSPRTASVTALDRGSTLRLDGPAFMTLLPGHLPVLRGVVKILCLRLSDQPWEAPAALASEQVPPRSLAALAGLPPAAFEALERWGTVVRLDAGEEWALAPHEVVFVLSGKLSRRGVVWTAGALADDVTPFTGRPADAFRAVERSELFVLEADLYLQSLAVRPEALAAFLKSLVRRLKGEKTA